MTYLETERENVVLQAITEGFIWDDTVAIDATHFEARDQSPPKEKKPKSEPKKRGRKSKEEREQWLKEKAKLPLYDKKLEAQLDVPLADLRAEVPQDPKWGVKKNSEGQHVFWFGFTRVFWPLGYQVNIIYRRFFRLEV